MKILLTGAAGFIGFYTALHLLKRGDEVIGLDNINDYYDINLKYNRLKVLGISRQDAESRALVRSTVYENFSFIKADLVNDDVLARLFKEEKFDAVCHLAAQAGVRYSITNPKAYAQSNLVSFLNILEECRHNSLGHLVYASSSSVYGLNESVPFSEKHNVDHPVSLYAASKKSNELMAHSYSHLYNLPVTGLRFFTVYGPWGRPDMAPMLFSSAIMNNKPIKVFNNGHMERDFTYVEDIVDGIVRVLDKPASGNQEWSGLSPDPSSGKAPYRVYNIGNSEPVNLMDFITTLEKYLGREAEKIYMPMQPGDVVRTWADTSLLEEAVGYKPSTSLEAGLKEFAQWFKNYKGGK